jgi:hypothetical protein
MRHQHALLSLAHTVCIILPLFVTFSGEIAVESNLQALASPNDPFSKEQVSAFVMSHHYYDVLRPLSALRTVVLALDGRHICSIWLWRVLEEMINVFVIAGIEVHLESDIRCIEAAAVTATVNHSLVTSWTVSNVARDAGGLLVFAKLLKRLEYGLRHLTVQWNSRGSKSVLCSHCHLPLTAVVQETFVEAFCVCLKDQGVTLPALTTLRWGVQDLFIGDVAPDSDNIWRHYLLTPMFTLGGLVVLLEALPAKNKL